MAERPPLGESAATLERKGFEALLARDVTAARAAFEAAYTRAADYHNVDEIRQLLRENERALADRDSTAWPRLYRTILSDLSWGMPKELRPGFRKAATASYRAPGRTLRIPKCRFCVPAIVNCSIPSRASVVSGDWPSTAARPARRRRFSQY